MHEYSHVCVYIGILVGSVGVGSKVSIRMYVRGGRDPLTHACILTHTYTRIQVQQTCGKNLVPVVLELGGKDPFIICDDASPASIEQLAVRGVFQNMGQVGLYIHTHTHTYAHVRVYGALHLLSSLPSGECFRTWVRLVFYVCVYILMYAYVCIYGCMEPCMY